MPAQMIANCILSAMARLNKKTTAPPSTDSCAQTAAPPSGAIAGGPKQPLGDA